MNLGGKLKFIGIELMAKNALSTDSPETGLFRGVRERIDKDVSLTLFLLGDKSRPDSIRGFNAALYNIMTLMFMYGQTKEMIVFKNTTEDQKQANELLESVIEQMKEDGMMLANDPEIADVSKFEDVPDEFFSVKKGTSTSNTPNRPTNSTTINNGGTPDWKKRQEEEKKQKEKEEKMRWTPFTFTRKKETPALKDLNLIKKKIAALAIGEYECVLPAMVGDEEKEEEEDKKTTAKK